MSNQSVGSSFLAETQGQITRELLCFVRIGAGQSREGGIKSQPAAERPLLFLVKWKFNILFQRHYSHILIAF